MLQLDWNGKNVKNPTGDSISIWSTIRRSIHFSVNFLHKEFWSQLAEFLAVCRNARPGLLDDLSRHPLCDGLGDYSDDDWADLLGAELTLNERFVNFTLANYYSFRG
jgi:hypothetical protein